MKDLKIFSCISREPPKVTCWLANINSACVQFTVDLEVSSGLIPTFEPSVCGRLERPPEPNPKQPHWCRWHCYCSGADKPKVNQFVSVVHCLNVVPFNFTASIATGLLPREMDFQSDWLWIPDSGLVCCEGVHAFQLFLGQIWNAVYGKGYKIYWLMKHNVVWLIPLG